MDHVAMVYVNVGTGILVQIVTCSHAPVSCLTAPKFVPERELVFVLTFANVKKATLVLIVLNQYVSVFQQATLMPAQVLENVPLLILVHVILVIMVLCVPQQYVTVFLPQVVFAHQADIVLQDHVFVTQDIQERIAKLCPASMFPQLIQRFVLELENVKDQIVVFALRDTLAHLAML